MLDMYEEAEANHRKMDTEIGSFILTRVYPYGLWKIKPEKGATYNELKGQSFTSAERAAVFLQSFVQQKVVLGTGKKKRANGTSD